MHDAWSMVEIGLTQDANRSILIMWPRAGAAFNQPVLERNNLNPITRTLTTDQLISILDELAKDIDRRRTYVGNLDDRKWFTTADADHDSEVRKAANRLRNSATNLVNQINVRLDCES